MAGVASFGMPMGNDKSAAANKARKDALARIALLKKKEMDTATYIAGEVAKLLLPDPATLKRAVKDPSGTLRGAAEIASLTNPSSYIARASNLIQGKGLSLYGADMEDVGQAAEIAGLIPGGKGVGATFKVAEKGLSVASKGLLRGVGDAATRTSADALSAASGGLIRGGPVSATRTAPEPDEFDAIINAAKAEDPTLGNVVPEGTPTNVFRSELDWDPEMSVNYEKARKKITMDLLSRQRGADGEDPTLINPLIDDSIAALDDEIGNLSMRNYNHNDLEDFLGKIAAPDDYVVADATLAKRADELVSSIDDDAVVWGVDPEAWLRETGRSGGPEDVRGLLEGLDMGAASPVSEAEGILKGTTRSILPDLKAAREGGLTRGTGETVSKTGTPGYQAVDAKGKPIGRRQKLKESDQGNDLRTYNEKLLMPDRVRQANKRATKMNPDALQINPSSDVSQKEIRKLIENASRDYEDVWNEFGLGGFDLSHITPLEKGGKNAWANIKLMPTEANLDQGVLPFSVWRYLSDTEKLKQLGGGGFGLGKYAEGQ